MTSRSKKNVFPSFARRLELVAEVSQTNCRFCPDWATVENPPGATCDADLLKDSEREAEEFSDALERYRLVHRRRFVSCEEAIAVFKSLGYRKAPRNKKTKNGAAYANDH